jgi:hypothetical protein
MHPWLSRLRHDLVKRAVWSARDLRDAPGDPDPADLLQLRRGLLDLRDEDGRAISAAVLWDRLRAEAPAVAPAALESFGGALREAQAAVSGLPGGPGGWRAALDAVLRLEPAFADLARTLEGE